MRVYELPPDSTVVPIATGADSGVGVAVGACVGVGSVVRVAVGACVGVGSVVRVAMGPRVGVGSGVRVAVGACVGVDLGDGSGVLGLDWGDAVGTGADASVSDGGDSEVLVGAGVLARDTVVVGGDPPPHAHSTETTSNPTSPLHAIRRMDCVTASLRDCPQLGVFSRNGLAPPNAGRNSTMCATLEAMRLRCPSSHHPRRGIRPFLSDGETRLGDASYKPELPISSCLDPSNAPSSTRAIVVSLTDAVNHPIKLTKPSLGVVS